MNLWPLLHIFEEPETMFISDPNECFGGRIWTECGSLCSPTCEDPQPECADMCVEKCECKEGMLWSDLSGECVHPDDCPGKRKRETGSVRERKREKRRGKR